MKEFMRFKMILLGIVAIPTLFLLPMGCMVFGVRTTEEPGYSVLLKDEQIEIRKYEAYLIAQTKIDQATYREAGNSAFRKLFNYISGKNIKKEKISMTAPVLAESSSKGEKIDMTAPVLGEKNDNGWNYAFVLPKKYKIDSAPEPLDESVKIKEVKEKIVAVVRYSGSWGEEGFNKHSQKLKDWLKAKNYEVLSQPRSAGYDPPWTVPSLRRNEVMIDIVFNE